MEALWEEGYRQEMPWRILKDYVEAMCGGFRTTVTDYLGKRARFYKSRGRSGILKTPAKKGYLEKFGFVEKKSPKIMRLHHERVGRPYHYEQSDIIDFSLSFSKGERTEKTTTFTTDGTTVLLHTQSEREIKKFKQTCQNPTLTLAESRILKAATNRG